MIRGNIRDSGDIWAKIHDGLQLERAHLTDGRRLFFRIQRFRRKRISDISHNMGIGEFTL